MKRLIVAIGLLLTTNCYANTISIQPFISGNDVTIARLETQRSTIQNVINGNISGGSQNILAGSITSSDLATAINPVTFRNEAFNDWTYSGMLPPTSASLSTTITAGVSYVNGVRVQTEATAHTFTASKDTYLYINAGGFFDYVEVANGASAPATPANELLLAVVISNGTAITSVTDSRTLSIQITANSSNFAVNYRDQSYVSRDTTVNFYVKPGTFAIGNSNYTNTASTSTKSVVTGANWIEGGYPSGYAGRIFVYGYNNSGTAYDFKFSSADVAFADTSSNTGGILRYYVSGGTTYRALGWAYLSADVVQLYQTSDFRDVGNKNIVSRTSATAVSTASTSLVNDNFADIKFYSSGGFCTIEYSAGVANDGASLASIGIMIDSFDIATTLRSILGQSSNSTTLNVTSVWKGILGRGVHTIQGRFSASANSAFVNNRTLTITEE